jgi:ankyrin repeat protein
VKIGDSLHDKLFRVLTIFLLTGAALAQSPRLSDAIVGVGATEPTLIFPFARSGTVLELNTFIVNGADLAIRGEYGQTPLVYAINSNSAEAVLVLLDATPDEALGPTGAAHVRRPKNGQLDGEVVWSAGEPEEQPKLTASTGLPNGLSRDTARAATGMAPFALREVGRHTNIHQVPSATLSYSKR